MEGFNDLSRCSPLSYFEVSNEIPFILSYLQVLTLFLATDKLGCLLVLTFMSLFLKF